MDVLSAALWVPRAPLRHYLAHVHPVLAGSIDSSAMAPSFQAKGSADTKRLSVGCFALHARRDMIPVGFHRSRYVFGTVHVLWIRASLLPINVLDPKADITLIL